MAVKKESFNDRARSLEESYFKQKELELIEKAREKARRQELRQVMAEKLETEDHEILEVCVAMGFDRDTVRLLHVLPLVQVAWADGEVSPRERKGILEAASVHGVTEGSEAHAMLLSWLEKSPGAKFFERGLAVIRGIIPLFKDARREDAPGGLVSACQRIAEASGGILGFGKISAEEQAVIDRIAAEIEKGHGTTAQDVAASLNPTNP